MKTPVEYLLGQAVIASENWHRDGALVRHFIPSRSIDQDFPEWGYRDDYWRDYVSQPPLSFMLHYWMTRAIPTADPVLLGRLLAEALIAMGVLVSGALLQDVFGFGATLVGLSSLIWGQPFLVWFIDGYYSTTPAMVCQLVLVSWCLRLFTRELVGEREGIPWRTRKRDLLIVSLLAYLGTFSEWIALFGNAVAVLAFVILGLALSVRKSSGARKAYAIALALVGGSVAAESTTVLLYGTRIGFAFYWHGFVSRVNERTGPSQEGFLPYTRVLIQQMERSWPASMLTVLVIMALVVCVYAGVTLIKGRLRSRATDGTLLLLAMVLGFGGPAAYCYRLKDLVEIHWWFAGTWAIGWMITICSFAYATRQLFRKLATAKGGAITYSTACAALWLGVVTWNLSFVDLRSPKGRFSNEIYRMLGRTLPRDGYPLVVADFPDLFGEYPFATAYLRRPIIRYNSSGDPFDSQGALFIKLGTTEDAMSDLINRYGFAGDLVYIAYDVSKRQCAFEDVNLERWHETVPLRVCRVRVRSLLQNPARLWSTSVSTTMVDVGSGASKFTVSVSAPRTWIWSAAGNGDFIGLASPTPITGPGTATFNVQPNPGFVRLSTVTVAGQPVRITQTGMAGFENCVSDLGVQDRWRALGGIRTAQASVSASVGCVWVATSTVPWIALSARSGTGDGRFSYTVAPNVGPDARTGSVVVGGRTAKVVELPCWYTISAIAVNVRAQGETVKLTLTGECTWTWTAVSEDAFVRVVSGKTGTGSGAVTFVVAPNTGAAREATLKIAGYKVAAIQAGS